MTDPDPKWLAKAGELAGLIFVTRTSIADQASAIALALEEAHAEGRGARFVSFDAIQIAGPDDGKPPRYRLYGIRADGVRVRIRELYLRDTIAEAAHAAGKAEGRREILDVELAMHRCEPEWRDPGGVGELRCLHCMDDGPSSVWPCAEVRRLRALLPKAPK